jgi:putative ABC transport system permease protein
MVQLAGAATLLLVNAGLSVWLGFGSPLRWLIASLRTVVQLMVLGYVLVPIFRLSNPFLVTAMALLMVGLAAWPPASRWPSRHGLSSASNPGGRPAT